MASGIELIISSICNATFCEAVYDNPLVDSQLTLKQSEILHLTNELNGKHLKFGTYNNYPLSWVEKNDNGTLVGCGVSFQIVKVLQQRFNFTYEIVTPAKNFEVGGSKPEDSLIGLVNSSAVDMAAAFVPALVKFRKKVQFSTNLDEGVWMMMLKRPKESAAGSGLLAPFNTDVWYLILAAVLSFGPIITLLTQMRSRLVRDKEKEIKISPSFWFVYAAFIKQGTTLAPENNTCRLLFATWWIFILLLSSFYTANLTAFLTLSKFTLDIENTADLIKKNYRWVAADGGTVQYVVKDPDEDLFYLYKMVLNGRAEFRSFTADTDYLPLVMGGAVLVKEQIGIDHLMYNDYLRKTREGVDEADRCTYVVAPNAFMRVPRAFMFPFGSPLKALFDPILTRLLQAGIMNYLQHRDLPSTKICPLDLQSKDRKLRNTDLMMTYMIMVVGVAAAAAVFIAEMVIHRKFRIKLRKGSNKKRKSKTKKIRFKDDDDSRPPPYDSLFGRNSRYRNTENAKTQIINGREYFVVDTVHGDSRLIPVRTPSAFLYR